MSNSQVQTVDEDVVFMPVTESSPGFLHCERERQAVERLLSGGPEAFYSFISAERSGCFLSPEEVSQISGWAQETRASSQQVEKEEDGEEGTSDMDFSSTYFPSCSDTPVPCLQLGWPENNSWAGKEHISVYSSPPTEGQPPVREVIRHHFQKATHVIAIVTDRLTDGAVIDDLHNAASRGVPVYIVLNQRSIRENFTLNRLRHPNIQVRVLGGKTFFSRTGRMVIGEMKNNFILVDLETVIHGSYSLTWTDAHLHRQLITVLQGPVVELFDKEFRILYADSLPIPDTWRAAGAHADMINQLKDFSDLRFPRNLPMEPEIAAPPSPPADFILDWEAMGVVQRDSIFPESLADQHEDLVQKKTPLQNNVQLDQKAPIMDVFSQNRNQLLERQIVCEKTARMMNNLPLKSSFNDTQPSVPGRLHLTSPETMKSVERKFDQTFSRQLSNENTHLDDISAMRLGEKGREQIFSAFARSMFQKNQHVRTEKVLEERSSTEENSYELEHAASSRKPLILRVPQSESFSSMSDIMRRMQSRQNTAAQHRQESKATVTEVSPSMMDLNITVPKQDAMGALVPRFKTTCLDQDMTPAFALMKKRNDEMKSILYRNPNTFLPNSRPRNAGYGLKTDWRRSLAEKGELE